MGSKYSKINKSKNEENKISIDFQDNKETNSSDFCYKFKYFICGKCTDQKILKSFEKKTVIVIF